MKLIKEEIKLDKGEKELIDIYPIDSEVLLTTIIDDISLYCIDKIKEVDITKDGIFYYFEESEMRVKDKDILPYSIKNEDVLKELGYTYSWTGYSFDVLYNKDIKGY